MPLEYDNDIPNRREHVSLGNTQLQLVPWARWRKCSDWDSIRVTDACMGVINKHILALDVCATNVNIEVATPRPAYILWRVPCPRNYRMYVPRMPWHRYGRGVPPTGVLQAQSCIPGSRDRVGNLAGTARATGSCSTAVHRRPASEKIRSNRVVGETGGLYPAHHRTLCVSL